MLELSDVVTAYGPVRALNGVSLKVRKGSVTAVLGANGAGKTSLLRTISGLARAAEGSVALDGRDITALPTEKIVRLGVAHVPEDRGVITELTVEENLRLGALWRRDRGAGEEALREVYELVPALAERRSLSADTLSGGERQMLSISRALMGRPRLLLLDEPSLGLAPRIIARIMRQIADLRDRMGLTVLLVEQNARSALAIADHGLVLNLGQIVASDEPKKLALDQKLRHAYLGF